MKTITISGGFDPIHKGHVRLIHGAKVLGDKLIVILNNDNWLKKKKGFAFMDQKERKEIILALRDVDDVFITKHLENPGDMSVCNELKEIKPEVFGNGGDRKSDNVPEVQICKELGIEMEWDIGGEKIQSSSDLVKKAHKH